MRKALITLLFILTTFLVSRYVFEPANLYYELPWLDIPMHILGGYLIGTLFIILGEKNKTVGTKSYFFWALFLTMAAWEIFEYERGMVEYTRLYDYFDSIKDVAFGYLGAYLAYKQK